MLLNKLIKNAPEIEIMQLSCDSRIPMKDCIFFCIKGVKYNGHEYVDEAIKNGAKVIVYSDDIDTNKNAIFVKVNDVEDFLTKVTNKFYDYPSKKLNTYLVCGSYGRSSVSYLLNKILNFYEKTGSIGINGIFNGETHFVSHHSTLPILESQKHLAEFVKNEVRGVTLEANHLSLTYKKLNYLKPNTLIYTNTASENVDLGNKHINVYQRYLYTLDETTKVILNMDDIYFDDLYKVATYNKVTVGKNKEADYVIDYIHCGIDKTSFVLKFSDRSLRIETSLLGEPNVYNLSLALATVLEDGYDPDEIAELVKEIKPAHGVFERLEDKEFNVIIDCAYTIESATNVLEFVKNATGKENKVISILSINTTDDTERLKHLMEIANKNSDIIILSEDDTYEDDINDTFKLAEPFIKQKHLFIEDRNVAIETAIELMNTNDTLLILGKGDETFLYKGLTKIRYDGDLNVAQKAIEKRRKEEKEFEY